MKQIETIRVECNCTPAMFDEDDIREVIVRWLQSGIRPLVCLAGGIAFCHKRVMYIDGIPVYPIPFGENRTDVIALVATGD